MSILRKPYEISVWEDEWSASEGKFIEKKICIIGSDKMQSQSRVIEPNFTRNVNGVKKLSFKLYKKYVDNITGEKVDNIFAPLLINERKIKLKYGTYIDENGEERDQWYDFIIKNINETSTDYLYIYQLEDALVQELSKNGYNVVLDSQKQNNLGTAKKLATDVLQETDWTVDNESEVFVQKIEEALVYLKVKVGETLLARQIIDQSSFLAGVSVADEYTEITSINSDRQEIILGFYSSCTEKPHRFQFIYVNPLSNLERDEKRLITNTNCQYFIECEDPDNDYIEVDGFYLPRQLQIAKVDELTTDGITSEVTLSGRYRGARYGFSQQAEYIPALNKYVNLFDGPEYGNKETLYYGFEKTDYLSPAIIQNLVSSADFRSTYGWIATKREEAHGKAVIETLYGRFEGNKFVTCIEDVQAGRFEEKQAEYKSYLKMSFPRNGQGMVINSGPFDMRATLENLVEGDRLAMRYLCYQPSATGMLPTANLNITLGEYVYNKDTDSYVPKYSNERLIFSNFEKNGDYYYSTISGEGYSEEEFKKQSKIRICIEAPLAGTYYLENFELFKAVENEEGILITPDNQSDNLVNGVVKKEYVFFKPSTLDGITKPDQLQTEEKIDKLTYTKYKPRYNAGAEKMRTVSAKESNYFNILQNIAETFEAWLLLEIERSTEGAIIAKKVKFKNYAGGNNYAGFRYGVNLKDIQRTYESKNIVTKLIVKSNNNEYGKNGFCTIARAGANRSGETSIYDFQYYFNKGLLDETTYNNTLYAANYDANDTENLNGYFLRIKEINKQLNEKNEEWIKAASDLTHYKAQLASAEAGHEAAISGIEDVRERFTQQFGTQMENFESGQFEITAEIKEDSSGTITSSQFFTSKNIRTGKWSITGTLFRDITDGGISSTAKIELTQKTSTEDLKQEIDINYQFVDGLNFTGIYVEFIPTKPDLSSTESLYYELGEYYSAERQYSADKIKYNNFVIAAQSRHDQLLQEIDELDSDKARLNKLFFSRYSRFIQEGTWMDEKYYDDDLYYADALSVMYNSCYPQVAYNINVLELSALPGYEHFKFSPGEKTYAEDPDFFGSSRREEVIIAELSENLDDPSKNTIRVQNFKNQFQDLFQKITATVQQAQYSTGAYEKAVSFVESEPNVRSDFLTSALDAAGTILQTAGQQSVTQGNDGITVRSLSSPGNAIRLVGGAILLSKQDEKGELKWTTGITTEGISASLVTAGTINTGTINIMNGNEPAFRWNAFGISAFDDSTTSKFVRFDKYGIYGVQGVDGLTWAASSLDEVREKAIFYQTWDGIQIMPQHAKYKHGENDIELLEDYKIKLGHVDDSIFNKWDDDGIPVYDSESQEKKFVKLFSVGHQVQNGSLSENFVLYSDGTLSIENLKLPGTIEWTSASSPLKTVYAKTDLSAPENGTKFNSFPEEDGDNTEGNPYRWHTVADVKDIYYARTEDGGKTWSGPFLLNGLSITGTITEYAQGPRGAVLEGNGLSWGPDLPTELIPDKCLYTRTKDVYSDGNSGVWRYLVTLNGSPGQIGETGPAGPAGPKGDKGEDGTSVSIKASADECVELGHGYINEEGNLMVLTSIDPREFTDAGEIRGPQGETVYFHVAYANSADGSQDFSVSDYIDKSYIGHYTDTTEEDSLDYRSYKWMRQKGDQGDSGPKGPTIEQVKIYQTNNSTTVSTPEGNAPNLPTGWSLIPATMSSSSPYTWSSEGQKITTYKATDGTVDTEEYGNVWTAPELYAAYSGNTGINEQNYATYLRITNFSTEDGLYYGEEGADKGKLCINASFLKSGTILVGDKNDPVFSADIGSKIVKIGGFTVGPLVDNNYQSLYYGTRGEPGGVYVVPGGNISGFMTSIAGILRNDWVLMLGDSFGVTREGSLYAKAANFGNEITFLNVDGDGGLDNNQIGWRNYAADLPNTVTCTLGRVWIAGAYTTDMTEYSTTVTISGVPEEEFTIYVWFNNGGFAQVKQLTIGPTTDSSIIIRTSGENAPISLGINNSGIDSSGATIMYKRTWTDSVMTGGFAIGGNVVPGFSVVNNGSEIARTPFNYSLGTPELPWTGLVIKEDGVQEISDLNLKKDILPINDAYLTFYDALTPISYSFKKGKSGRTHIGFGAQQVRDALLSNGLTTTDFAGYCSEVTSNGEKHYLRYSEFIALNTWQIQKLKPRVQQLEEEIQLLRQRIVELESKI